LTGLHFAKLIGPGPDVAHTGDMHRSVRKLRLCLLDHLALCFTGDDGTLAALVFRAKTPLVARFNKDFILRYIVYS
jgi:hypothetical protein